MQVPPSNSSEGQGGMFGTDDTETKYANKVDDPFANGNIRTEAVVSTPATVNPDLDSRMHEDVEMFLNKGKLDENLGDPSLSMSSSSIMSSRGHDGSFATTGSREFTQKPAISDGISRNSSNTVLFPGGVFLCRTNYIRIARSSFRNATASTCIS